MKFKKEWTDTEYNAVVKCFSRWEKKNLIITYGRRERTTEDTYGLPYTSSSSFAMLSNTNVRAELRTDQRFNFEWLGLTTENRLVAGFSDYFENEKQIVIGTIQKRGKMAKHYVTAKQNTETITKGKSYRLIGLINDFYIVVDDKGENAIRHSSFFDEIEWNNED